MNQDSKGFTQVVELVDLKATETLGARIAKGLRSGDAVALKGELGTGKTTLARAILRALDVGESVPSPTFTLVQTYETPHLTVRHFDLYRIRSPREIDELGLEDALADGAVLIEWPERAAGRLPGDALQVLLIANGARRAEITGPKRWAPILTGADLVR